MYCTSLYNIQEDQKSHTWWSFWNLSFYFRFVLRGWHQIDKKLTTKDNMHGEIWSPSQPFFGRHATLGGALRDILKTAANETRGYQIN